MARTVDDVRLALDAMAGAAERKPAPHSVSEIRIGLPENFYFELVAPEVKAAVLESARQAEKLGACVIPVRVPDIEALNTAGLAILLSEASAVHQAQLRRRGDFGKDVLALLDQGSLIPAVDYVNAQRRRKQILQEFHQLFGKIDCLFTPSTPITAPRFGQTEITMDGAPYDTRMLTTRFARGINVLGFPGLSIPCGLSAEGLPVGLQMIARPLEENVLLDLGEAFTRL
jgi:aspartyl-tRNA(Asn)/glutamyl-tRNA(Gln) amidotransferase subunit A